IGQGGTPARTVTSNTLFLGESEMPFTKEQHEQLSGRDRSVLKQVAEYLGYENYADEDALEVLAYGCRT
ncbi:MAG TPA: hypothetical protein VMP01_04315, partial [Pirellulaceae bacterium]|nr:hypothetical protein [Pirellulaceae bacterium]